MALMIASKLPLPLAPSPGAFGRGIESVRRRDLNAGQSWHMDDDGLGIRRTDRIGLRDACLVKAPGGETCPFRAVR